MATNSTVGKRLPEPDVRTVTGEMVLDVLSYDKMIKAEVETTTGMLGGAELETNCGTLQKQCA